MVVDQVAESVARTAEPVTKRVANALDEAALRVRPATEPVTKNVADVLRSVVDVVASFDPAAGPASPSRSPQLSSTWSSH